MKDFFNPAIISAIISAVSLFAGIYFKQKSTCKPQVARERLEKAIFPFYVLLENELYMYSPSDTFKEKIDSAISFAESNRLLLGSNIYQSFMNFQNAEEQNKSKIFDDFSDTLVSEYALMTYQAGLPRAVVPSSDIRHQFGVDGQKGLEECSSSLIISKQLFFIFLATSVIAGLVSYLLY